MNEHWNGCGGGESARASFHVTFLAIIAAGLLTSQAAQGGVIRTWDNDAGDSSWFGGTNWNPNGGPATDDDLRVNAGSPQTALDVSVQLGGRIALAGAGTTGSFGVLYVGREYFSQPSHGELSISGGAQASSSTSYLGYAAWITGNGTGVATVDGAGSQWLVNGNLEVGRFGTSGELNIQNGGEVRVTGGIAGTDGSAESPVNLNSGTLDVGSIVENYPDFNWTGGTIRVRGDLSSIRPFDYALSLSNGMNLQVDGTMTVGPNSFPSTTTLTLDGGSFSADRVVVLSGCRMVFNSGSFDYNEVDARGGVQAAGALYVGAGKTQRIGGQGGVTCSDGYIGTGVGGDGEVAVGYWSSNTLHVGYESLGLMWLVPGYVETLGNAYVGELPGANGSVVMERFFGDTEWAIRGNLYIGDRGVGRVNMSDAADLRVRGSLYVGNEGRGTLYVDGSDARCADAYIGFANGSQGTASVDVQAGDWPGVWSVGNLLSAGHNGRGTLTIAVGGQVSSAVGAIGYGSTGNGSVYVSGTSPWDGSPSRWTVTGSLYLGGSASGPGGQGLLQVSDGGVVEVGGTLRIYPGGTLGGDGGTVIGDVLNEGKLSPGTSPGVITLNGDLLLATIGEVLIEILNSGPAGYDRIAVTGAAQLGGTLRVSLLPGFSFDVGDTFTFLTAGSMMGAFDAEALPGVPGVGPFFSVEYGATEVTLTAVLDSETTAAVPEPATLTLLALGGIGLLRRRRRAR